MDTDLTIQLFFFGSAVAVALEAYKERERQIARYVLWFFVALFGVLGFAWPSVGEGIPMVAQSLAELALNPVTWFVLFIALYFIIRPFWAAAPSTDLLKIESRLEKLEQGKFMPRQKDAKESKTESGAKKVYLTASDRERCSVALQDVHDFIGGKLRPFITDLSHYNTGKLNIFKLLNPITDQQKMLHDEAGQIWHKHAQYLDLISLDIMPILRGVQGLKNPIERKMEATDWPQSVKQERAKELAKAIGVLVDGVNEVWKLMPIKRAEYISGEFDEQA